MENERILKEQNFLLERKVQERTVALEEKNKEVTDSIHYAGKIQNALLAEESFLKEFLPEHFIFFRPKDIVSGDFYWATQRDGRFYLAVCDSTGHGVPGAFMSLLNISFLNEAINEENIISPALILDHVRKRLISNISKEGQKDGMDGVLLCFNKSAGKITYAAANNSPLLISEGSLLDLSKDKMPVGEGWERPFSEFTIEPESGGILYLLTDGFADQFGGPLGKKFKLRQLQTLLSEITNRSMNDQQKILSERFDTWKGSLSQVDDVCIMGIKVDSWFSQNRQRELESAEDY